MNLDAPAETTDSQATSIAHCRVLGRTRPSVQQLLRRYLKTPRQRACFSSYATPAASRAIETIICCRTGSLGAMRRTCSNCHGEIVKAKSCHLRACSVCGKTRRDVWRQHVIDWSLECDHLHCVTTLPHELGDLMFQPSGVQRDQNRRILFRQIMTTSLETLQRQVERHYGCRVGLIATLHTWGQRLNRHVHCHVIMTAGGLSLDGTRWVPISAADAAMQGPVIAEAFKRSYLRRLEGRLKRGELTWIGQSAPMAKAKVLTPKAQSLVDTIRAKRWVVDVQQTPSHYRGAVGVVNYLSAYVSGTAIGNGRIVGDDGQMVEIRIKDYAAGKGKRSTMKLSGDEFVQRFTDHILPRHFQRVRYAGLFTAAQRCERLAVCREKLADYYRSRGIRMPRGLAGGVTETVQLEKNYDCGHCQGKMTTTAEVSGKVMMRILSLTALATTRFVSGMTGTIADFCQHLKADNRTLNADACRRKPYVYLGDKEYRFAELVILQHIQAIEQALALAAVLEVEANAQPPPSDPSEGPLRCNERHLEAMT